MKKQPRVYACKNCGNTVVQIQDGRGNLACCGRPMPSEQESEGHKAQVKSFVKNGPGFSVSVESVSYPVEAKTFTERIEITDGKVTRRSPDSGTVPKPVFPAIAPAAPGAKVDLQSLFTLSYGLYIVASITGKNRFNGQISNAVMQVTDTPPCLAAAVNKTALTHECITESGVFSVMSLGESAPMEFIGTFGFRSGRQIDKFSNLRLETGVTGCPIVLDHTVACMEARVSGSYNAGTHTVFVGDVVAARLLASGVPMTYTYYREVLRGKTPPTAPTYRAHRG